MNNELDKASLAAAKEVARNLSAIKGEDGTHVTENLTAIIRSHYGSIQADAIQTCTWLWTFEENSGFWTAQCKEDWPIQVLHEGAKFCTFCGSALIVKGQDGYEYTSRI